MKIIRKRLNGHSTGFLSVALVVSLMSSAFLLSSSSATANYPVGDTSEATPLDAPGAVTADTCSTTGLLFSASGTFSDNDGVIDVSIYVDGAYRGGDTFWPPKTSGIWSVSNSAVPYGSEYTCIAVTARITDVNNNTTTSAPCRTGVIENCLDNKENDCDDKTDCADSECDGQCCKTDNWPNWKCCHELCSNTSTDTNNCGSCGNVCSGTTPGCCNGSCKDLASDNSNCGSCGTVCPSGQTCQSGSCGPTALTQISPTASSQGGYLLFGSVLSGIALASTAWFVWRRRMRG